MTMSTRPYWLIIATALIALIMAALTLSLITAPWLPRLLTEGYPAPVLGKSGLHKEVEGSPLKQVLPGAPQADLNPAMEKLFQDSGGKALLVFQGGALKIEHYAEGYNQETRFNSYSMVKSLVGLLILRAIDEGKIVDTNQPVSTFLPEIKDEPLGETTIQELLDMKSRIVFQTSPGKAFSGSDTKDLERTLPNPFGPMMHLHFTQLEPLLASLKVSPEEEHPYNYQNVNTALLGLILERIYQRPLTNLMSEKIWRPSGAASGHWRTYPETRSVTPYCCLYGTAQDWVHIGRFLSANGSMKEPFLSKTHFELLKASGLSEDALAHGVYRSHVRHDILDRKGEPLQGPFTYFIGQGGQMLYLMPSHDLVVVRFGDMHQKLHSTLYEAWRSVLPSK